jgi:translation initiation factor IF-2
MSGRGSQEAVAMEKDQRIGVVTHFYNKIQVAVVRLTDRLALGDRVRFRGMNTDFEQEVRSMEIEHASVSEASAGMEVAMKVEERVRKGDGLYRPMSS